MQDLKQLAKDQLIFNKEAKELSIDEKRERNDSIKIQENYLKNNSNWKTVFDLFNTFQTKNLLPWIMDSYEEGTIESLKDIDKPLNSAIDNFNWLKRNRYIDEESQVRDFQGLKGLENFLEQYQNDLEKRKIEVEEIEKGREGGKIIYDGDQIKIIKLLTKEGACYYGKGTKWCTASPSRVEFGIYNYSGPLYIIQPKNPTREGEKYQIHFEKEEYTNERDRPIPFPYFIENFPELYFELPKINPKFKPLKQAIQYGRPDRLRELIEKGADVNKRYDNGDTPLHFAISRLPYEPDIKTKIEILVEKGADVHAKDKAGYTPLMRSAWDQKENLEVIKFLLDNGADPYAKYDDGKTIFDPAFINYNKENLDFVKEYIQSEEYKNKISKL